MSKDIKFCDACEDQYCGNCSPNWDCYNCGAELCNDCQLECMECGEYVCRECKSLAEHSCSSLEKEDESK